MTDSPRIKIAVCNDIFEFSGNRLFDPNWSNRFPGTGWVSILSTKASIQGWDVASGDLALSHVMSGYWNASEVFVIQELDSSYGRRLLKLGSKPLLLTCLESPLYASKFFDELATHGSVFPEVMAPALAHPLISGRFWSMRFPCFFTKDLSRSTPEWSNRKFLTLIAANKYWSERERAPTISKPRQYLHWLRSQCNKFFSKTRRNASTKQLHDARLELVHYFSNTDSFELYGSRWNDLSHLPKFWREKFPANLQVAKGGVSDKLETLENFRFSICFENVAMPGYVTEKIFQSLLVKTIPVYLGAPDIRDFVPDTCFVDAKAFSSPESLHTYLMSLSEEDATNMIEAGQKFLNSESAYLHRYEGFADLVINLAKKHEKKV